MSESTVKTSVSKALQQVATYEYQIRLVAQAALSWVEDTQDEIATAVLSGEEGLYEDAKLLLKHRVYLERTINDMT